MGYCSHARYKFVCCVLCVLGLVCVYSHVFGRSWAGRCSRWRWMGLVGFLPCLWRLMWSGSVVYCFYICVIWCWFCLEGWWWCSFFPIGLGNTFFFFFLVWAHRRKCRGVSLGNTFDCYQCSAKLVRLKVCYRFYLMSFYLWLL